MNKRNFYMLIATAIAVYFLFFRKKRTSSVTDPNGGDGSTNTTVGDSNGGGTAPTARNDDPGTPTDEEIISFADQTAETQSGAFTALAAGSAPKVKAVNTTASAAGSAPKVKAVNATASVTKKLVATKNAANSTIKPLL